MANKFRLPIGGWTALSAQSNAKFAAKQTAARNAARSLIVAATRATGATSRLPVTVRMPQRRMRAGENKQVDTNLTTVSLNATQTSVVCINGVAQGAANYQRIGNKINPKLSDLSLVMRNASTTDETWVRWALIWDSQPPVSGTAPTYDEIYQGVNAAGTTSSVFFANRNMNTTDRFHTIASAETLLLARDSSAGGLYMKDYRSIRPLTGLQQQFRGSTSGAADISTGALYLVLYAPSSATAQVVVSYDHRFKYTDN